MPNQMLVCAHDPCSPEAVGAVVSDPKAIAKAEASGAIFLPVDPPLFKRLPLGGFVRRSWGPEGWGFDLGRGEGGSPVALQVAGGDSVLSWAAEVTTMPSLRSDRVAHGKLQLALVRSSVGTLAPGYTQVDPVEPFRLSGAVRLILRGAVRLNSNLDGFVAMQLWGVCAGVSVRWIAVSQASVSE